MHDRFEQRIEQKLEQKWPPVAVNASRIPCC